MYIVLELQTNKDGTVGNITSKYDNQAEAESKFYAVCSAAALSSLPVHSVVLLENTGMQLMQRCYIHKERSDEG